MSAATLMADPPALEPKISFETKRLTRLEIERKENEEASK